MRRWLGLVLLIVLLACSTACSNLTEGEGGIVAIEIVVPEPPVIAVGQTLQLSARPLNRDGDSVAAEVTWGTPDATLSIESATGLLTGVSPGTGRVQASAGSLASATVTFTVTEPAASPSILSLGRSLRRAR